MAVGLIKAPPYLEFQVSKKKVYLFQIFVALPVKSFFIETKI